MNLIDKKKLHDFLTKRYEALKHQSDRDFGGGMAGKLEATREAKYWKEAIERGEFDYEPMEQGITGGRTAEANIGEAETQDSIAGYGIAEY